MTTLSFPAGERPTIRLRHCGDDLQIAGADTSTIEIQSGADDEDLAAAVAAGEEELLIDGFEDNVVLRVPRAAVVIVEEQAGTITIANVAMVRLTGAEGDVRLRMIEGVVDLGRIEGSLVVERTGRVTADRTIEGDVRITSAAAAHLGQVEGDVRLIDVADVHLDHISGDIEISGASERCVVDEAEGDLRLRDCGPSAIGHVAGDVSVARARGLTIDHVDGDCSIVLDEGSATVAVAGSDFSARLKSGALQLGEAQGDATVEGGYGDIKLGSVEGDLTLRLVVTEADYAARVEGDATLVLPERCDVRVEARARGGIGGLQRASGRKRSDTLSAVAGSGRGSLELDVGGELSIRGAGASRLADTPRAAQGSRPAVMIGSGSSTRDTAATGVTMRLRPEDASIAVAPAPDDDRLAILRMLSEGKLDVEEAERLLGAVDARRSSSSPPLAAGRSPARVPREGDVFASLSADDLIALRQHGVDRQYIQQLRQAGYADLSVDQLVELRSHGVDSGFVASLHEAGIDDLSVEQLSALRAHGVDPGYIAEARRFGFGDIGVDELIALRAHGVDAQYIRQLGELNIRDLSYQEIIELRSHGVTPEYIAKMRESGFGDMSAGQLADLHAHGIDERYIKEMNEAATQETATNSEPRDTNE